MGVHLRWLVALVLAMKFPRLVGRGQALGLFGLQKTRYNVVSTRCEAVASRPVWWFLPANVCPPATEMRI